MISVLPAIVQEPCRWGMIRWIGRGKPIIAIINTWSDAQPCHAHFKDRVEWVKRGILQAGGFPLELSRIVAF